MALVVTSHGGHGGFIEGNLFIRGSYVDRVMAQFATAIFNGKMNHGKDMKSPGGGHLGI